MLCQAEDSPRVTLTVFKMCVQDVPSPVCQRSQGGGNPCTNPSSQLCWDPISVSLSFPSCKVEQSQRCFYKELGDLGLVTPR